MGDIEKNEIIFSTKDTNEVLRLCGNGDIFVQGRLAENDKEVVEGMREFLKQNKKYLEIAEQQVKEIKEIDFAYSCNCEKDHGTIVVINGRKACCGCGRLKKSSNET